jgi:hypothetical protein
MLHCNKRSLKGLAPQVNREWTSYFVLCSNSTANQGVENGVRDGFLKTVPDTVLAQAAFCTTDSTLCAGMR